MFDQTFLAEQLELPLKSGMTLKNLSSQSRVRYSESPKLQTILTFDWLDGFLSVIPLFQSTQAALQDRPIFNLLGLTEMNFRMFLGLITGLSPFSFQNLN